MNKQLCLLVTLFALTTLTGCLERGDTELTQTTLPANTPDRFLQYLNRQASLAAGDYVIKVGTATAGETGDYQLTLTFDDGSTTLLSGSWSNSLGNNPTDAHPEHTVTLPYAGGLAIAAQSSVDSVLFLFKNDVLIAEDDNSGSAINPLINLPSFKINSTQYAQAYYEAADPNDERTTLTDWKTLNGFDQGYDVHVIFRDTKDLGYGRDMYARQNSNGDFAVMVNNFIVQVVPGDPSNYGPLNLYAAIDQDYRYHIGTNAIEFSPIDPLDPSSEKIARFFTFAPADEYGVQHRLESADLDGRGVKHAPGMCLVCHGGKLLPLDENGDFQTVSLASAKFNQLEVDSFEFADQAGYTQADQEDGIKFINELVHSSYVAMSSRAATSKAFWNAAMSIEIAEGRYGGSGLPSETYVEGFVPTGWQQNGSRPEGVELLYTEVIEPHCISCHALQGHKAGDEATALGNAINFSNYEKFISYNDRIIDFVFRKGLMPLSLRNYEQFWFDPTGAPSLLASFLTGFDLADSEGNVVPPGKAVAYAGEKFATTSPTQLDGSQSFFSDQYSWQIISQPGGSIASLDDATLAMPVLTADTNGDYVLQLITANDQSTSEAVTQTITIDSTLGYAASELNFADDIVPLLSVCATCHISGTNLPVYYDNLDTNLYPEVLARVNLEQPSLSPLLIKPTNVTHGGGIQLDLSDPTDFDNYSLILDWIKQGAVCGTNLTYCN